jgi:hypothetical protein
MSSSLITKALQARLASCGLDWVKLNSLHLDSKAKTIAVEVTLEGEDAPVKAEVEYSLGGDNALVIREVKTSRKWMTEGLRLALIRMGNRIPLPGGLQGQIIRVML